MVPYEDTYMDEPENFRKTHLCEQAASVQVSLTSAFDLSVITADGINEDLKITEIGF